MEYEGVCYREKPIWGLLSFHLPFSLLLFIPEGNRGGTRKGIKFWIERLIMNSSGELGFTISSLVDWTGERLEANMSARGTGQQFRGEMVKA